MENESHATLARRLDTALARVKELEERESDAMSKLQQLELREREGAEADLAQVETARRELGTETKQRVALENAIREALKRGAEQDRAAQAQLEKIELLEGKVHEGARRRAHLLERAEAAEASLRRHEAATPHAPAELATPPRVHTNSAFSLTPSTDGSHGVGEASFYDASHNVSPVKMSVAGHELASSGSGARPAPESPSDRLLRSILGPIRPVVRASPPPRDSPGAESLPGESLEISMASIESTFSSPSPRKASMLPRHFG